MSGHGWFWTQDEWADWSNRLAELIPEDDVGRYSNPDGAQEGIVEDCLRAYVSERDALAARLASVKALADEWAAEGDEMSHWFAAQVLYDLLDQARAAAVLGSDAHTEQKGAGE